MMFTLAALLSSLSMAKSVDDLVEEFDEGPGVWQSERRRGTVNPGWRSRVIQEDGVLVAAPTQTAQRASWVLYNDVDFCLKIRAAGHRIVLTPFAELYHHESVSRGLEDTAEKRERFRGEMLWMRDKWGDQLDADPYFNPNLNLDQETPSLAIPPRVEKPWERRNDAPADD